MLNPCCFSSDPARRGPEELVALPLPQVRLLLHGHQQGGRPPAAAPEARLHHGRRLREVHADAVLHGGGVRAQRQADALPLPPVPVRRPRAQPDGGPQVQAHERVSERLA